jgi:hypothetical protein
MVTAVPNRSDSVDNKFGWQVVAFGQLGIAGVTANQGSALRQQAWTRRAMDGAIHATSAQQGIVGCVDDGIDVEVGDIRLKAR